MPAATDVGKNYKLTIKLCDDKMKVITTASTTIRVVPAEVGAGTDLTCLIIGDSLTDQQTTLAAIDDYTGHTVTITESQNPFGMARQLFRYQGSNRTNFFIPQTNETGYWWQGEDARLASLAVMGLKGKSTSTTPDDMVQLAVDQLDWILGKNPYGFCMLQGAGSQKIQVKKMPHSDPIYWEILFPWLFPFHELF